MNDFDVELQTAQFWSTSGEMRDTDDEDGDVKRGIAQNSWQIGVYQ